MGFKMFLESILLLLPRTTATTTTGYIHHVLFTHIMPFLYTLLFDLLK